MKSVSFHSNSFDPFEFSFFAVFIQWGSWIVFLFVRRQDIVNQWDFPSKIPRNCHRRLVPESNWHQWEMFVKISPRKRPVCLAVFFGSTLLACFLYASSFPLTAFYDQYPKLFKEFAFPHSSQLSWNLFTANNLCIVWRNNFQQVSTHTFSGCWDDVFMKKCQCRASKKLCNCTEIPSTLSTKNHMEWNLYFPWKSHRETSFSLDMKIGNFSRHQNKSNDTHRNKGFFATRVSQHNVNTGKKWAEVRIVSNWRSGSSCIVQCLYKPRPLPMKKKRSSATKEPLCCHNFCTLSDLCLYRMSVDGQCREQLFI